MINFFNELLGGPEGQRRRRRNEKGMPTVNHPLGPVKSCSSGNLFGTGEDVPSSSPTGGEFLDRIRNLADDLEKFELDIEKALVYAGGSHTYADVVAGVMQGKLHFYPLEQSFIICEVYEYPQFRTYHIFLAGGSMSEILEFEPILRTNGAELGCSKLTLAGRLGWTRVLLERGWTYDLAVMSKEIA
jgi:hypothetical protein